MAYDAADQYVVLFQGDGAYNSTWELNFTAGGPPPLSVEASPNPLSGDAPFPVTFHALASGGTPPYSYSWSFGTGATSSSENTSFTYSTAATYDAQLNVTDHAGGSIRENWSIDVRTAPVVPPPVELTISASPSTASINETVTLTSTVSGGIPPYSFRWNLGDRATASTQNTSHQYAVAGTYDVILNVTDSKDTSVMRNITVSVQSPAPAPAATGSNDLTYGILLAVVVAIVLAVVAVAWRRSRRGSSGPGPPSGIGPNPPP